MGSNPILDTTAPLVKLVKALPPEGRDFPGSKPGRATKLCRRTRIGLSAELKPPCLSVRIRPPAPCARSPIGRGGRLKPGSRAGSSPAARTTGGMTRLEERRTPNPFLQGSNPWSPANKFAPEANWRSGCLQSSSW